MNRDSAEFIKECKEYIIKNSMLPDNVSTVVAGLSGGADSVCLLSVLNSLKNDFGFNLIAVHVNHGIRGEEAKRDQDFSENYCKKLGIPFKIFSYDCPSEAKKTGEGLEECGRRLRYQSFNSVCRGGNYRIATAHNANDNAETVLFNISRGSSLKGACGIPSVRDNIIRPVLFASREQIEKFCNDNSLEYITDSTNISDDYSRNKIRHSVLPVLSEINSGAISSFTRFSQNAKDDSDYLEKIACKSYNESIISKNEFDLSYLKELDVAVLKRVICKITENFCGRIPDYAKIKEIINLFFEGGKIQVFGNCYLKVNNDKLLVFDNDIIIEEIPGPVFLNNAEFELKFGNYTLKSEKYTICSKKINRFVLDNLIDYDKIIGVPVLRTRIDGDTFTFAGRNVTKSLKKLFNESKIPVSQRSFLPIISDDKGVIWIFGFGTVKRCRVTEKSENIYFLKGEES